MPGLMAALVVSASNASAQGPIPTPGVRATGKEAVVRVVKLPTGLFVCRGPGPTPPQDVDFPFITGWLVRPGWADVEPIEGQYDWSLIEGEIATAKRLKKKITLAILGGPQTPAWVYEAGAKDVRYTITSRSQPGRAGRIPPLWDEVYLRKWTAFIRALGRRFAVEDTIVLVHMTGATDNGLEMHLPTTREDRRQWRELGYTPEKVVAAWTIILDSFGGSFPRTALDLDVHPVLGTDRIAEEVAAHGHRELGGRFGIFGGWLSGRSAREDPHHSGMHVIARDAGRRGFVGFQLIGNETRQPDRFTTGGIWAAIDQAMGWGARYFEVWRADAINPGMHGKLSEIARRIGG
jgi:hypothetical protein